MEWRKLNLSGGGQEQVPGCCWHVNELLYPKIVGNFLHMWSMVWAYTSLHIPAQAYTGLHIPAQAYTGLHIPARPAQANTYLHRPTRPTQTCTGLHRPTRSLNLSIPSDI